MGRLDLSILVSVVAFLFVAHAHDARSQDLPDASPPRYSITSLESPNPSQTVAGIDLNNRGEVLLRLASFDSQRAAIWRAGKITELPMLPNATFSAGGSINDSGEVAGSNFLPHGEWPNVLWISDKLIDLGSPTPGAAAATHRVNNRRQIAFSSAGVPFRWEQGTYTRLTLPPGGATAFVTSINNGGTILGWGRTRGGTRGLLWTEAGSLVVLEMLPGAVITVPQDLNDQLEVVGTATKAVNSSRAFLWRRGRTTELPRLSASDSSEALSINFWGQIVGAEIDTNHDKRAAVLWDRGRVYDLNQLIRSDDPLKPYVHLQTAHRVNDWGQILVVGVDSRSSEPELSFVLTPSR